MIEHTQFFSSNIQILLDQKKKLDPSNWGLGARTRFTNKEHQVRAEYSSDISKDIST